MKQSCYNHNNIVFGFDVSHTHTFRGKRNTERKEADWFHSGFVFILIKENCRLIRLKDVKYISEYIYLQNI